ncbi:MAG: PAS domain-containing protein, partial [Bradyrhizobium sp.]|nr:PAS domain-containing protein [Bradyrhizobium sp.]
MSDDPERLIDNLPDAVISIDVTGAITRANRAFLELVEVGSKEALVGEKLSRWLTRPGADLSVLISNVERHGTVRLLSTTIQGELGTETEVEISAAAHGQDGQRRIGLVLRNIARRLSPT